MKNLAAPVVLSCLVALTGCVDGGFELPELRTGERPGALVGVLDTSASGGRVAPAGLAVILIDQLGSRQEQRTDENGAFAFSNLADGSYTLDVDLTGFKQVVKVGLVIRGGAKLDVGTLSLEWLLGAGEQLTTLTGRVQLETGSPGDARVEFLAQPQNAQLAIASVAADGRFVQQLPRGVYTLRVHHPLYRPEERRDVLVGESATVDLTDEPLVLLLNPARVEGLVLEESEAARPDGTLERTVRPAAGVTVTVQPSGKTTATGSDGRFALDGLAGMASQVLFSKAGYHDPAGLHFASLAPGETASLGEITLKLDRASIAGTVESSDRNELTGAVVSVVGAGYSSTVAVDPSSRWKGSFLITGVPLGTWEVVARQQKYRPASLTGVRLAARDAVVELGQPLTLQPLEGDFLVDDGDPDNTPGYTRTREVTLRFNNVSGASCIRIAASEAQLASATCQPFSTAVPHTLDDRDGTHALFARYEDSQGTESQLLSGTVILDREPPIGGLVELEGGRGFTRDNRFLSVALDAKDPPTQGADVASGIAAMRLAETIDTSGSLTTSRQPFLRNVTFTRSTQADGPQTVHAQFIDHAGNVSSIASDTVVIDTVPPDAIFTIAPSPEADAPGYTRSALITLERSVREEPHGGFVRGRVANSAAELTNATFAVLPSQGCGTGRCESSTLWSLDARENGSRTVHLEFEDAAGNRGQVQTASIVFDDIPPAVTFTHAGPSPTNASNVPLTIFATDAGGLATLPLTLGEDSLFTSTGTLGPMAMPAGGAVSFTVSAGDGRKTLFARVRDHAGNETLRSVQLTVDREPPVGSFRIRGALADGTTSYTHTASSAVTLELTQTGADELFKGNGPLSSCPTSGFTAIPSGTIAHTLAAGDGAREVHLCLRDEAGNTVGPLVAGIAVDSAALTGCTLSLAGRRADGSPAPTGKTANAQVAATIAGCSKSPTEMVLATSPLNCSSPSLSWSPFISGSTLDLPSPDGEKSVYGCVRDGARRVLALGPATMFLDTRAPENGRVELDGGAAYVTRAQYLLRGGYKANAEGSADGAVEWAVGVDASQLNTFTSLASDNPKLLTLGTEDGPRFVFARFRDELGNTSAPVADFIRFDTRPPDVAATTMTIQVQRDAAPGFSSQQNVGVAFTSAPSDAIGVAIVVAASSAACAASDFLATPYQPVLTPVPFQLPNGDGLYRVCARFRDEAGNPSEILSAAVTLDTTPPSRPELITSPRTLNLSHGAPYTLDIATPVVEANFARYLLYRNGTQIGEVTDASTTRFQVTLENPRVAGDSKGPESGTINRLAIKAVDLAGNESQLSSVEIVADDNPPDPVKLDPRWVNHGDRRATVYWDASPSGDVTHYLVHYGTVSGKVGTECVGPYDGIYANEGPSGFATTQLSTHISGLHNGAISYLTVRPVDRAGNVGASPAGDTCEVMLRPNEVSPNNVHTAAITPQIKRASRVAMAGNHLYVLGTSGTSGACQSTQGTATLEVFDVRTITQPVRMGKVEDRTSIGPTSKVILQVASGLDCQSTELAALAVDGPYLFTGAGTTLGIYDVSSPSSPTLRTSINVAPNRIRALVVRGDKLLAAGDAPPGSPPNVWGKLMAFDLAKLYDGLSGLPTAADIIGVGDNLAPLPTGLTWARNRALIVGEEPNFNESRVNTYRLDNALDGDPLTAFNTTSNLGRLSVGTSGSTSPIASGSHVYFGGSAFLIGNLQHVFTGAAYDPFYQLYSAPYASHGQFEVHGNFAFLNDDAIFGPRILDLTSASSSRSAGYYRFDSKQYQPVASTVYGNYLFAVFNDGQTGGTELQTFELATPTSPHLVYSATGAGVAPNLAGGFLVSGSGLVLDLHSGTVPDAHVPGNNVGPCTTDLTLFEDVAVEAVGDKIRAFRLDAATDRDPLTNYTNLAYEEVQLAGQRNILGVEAYGNFLVTVASGGDGTWIQVFRASQLRNPLSTPRSPSRPLFKTSDSLGSFRVSSVRFARADLSMHEGRALLTLDSPQPVSAGGVGLYLVDLRSYFADPSRVPSADAEQGFFPLASAREVVGRGKYAYVAGGDALSIIDIEDALDNDARTRVTDKANVYSINVPDAVGVTVHGSHAVVTPGSPSAPGIYVIDVQSPDSPQIVSLVPYGRNAALCADGAGPKAILRGPRLYVSSAGALDVFDLE